MEQNNNNISTKDQPNLINLNKYCQEKDLVFNSVLTAIRKQNLSYTRIGKSVFITEATLSTLFSTSFEESSNNRRTNKEKAKVLADIKRSQLTIVSKLFNANVSTIEKKSIIAALTAIAESTVPLNNIESSLQSFTTLQEQAFARLNQNQSQSTQSAIQDTANGQTSEGS